MSGTLKERSIVYYEKSCVMCNTVKRNLDTLNEAQIGYSIGVHLRSTSRAVFSLNFSFK